MRKKKVRRKDRGTAILAAIIYVGSRFLILGYLLRRWIATGQQYLNRISGRPERPDTDSKYGSPIDRYLSYNVDAIERARRSILRMRAAGNFEYVARNARDAIGDCLAQSCLALRGQNDSEGARQAIRTVLEFVPAILEAVDAVQASGRTEENFVYCGNFRHVFVALFIAQQWALAKTLGEAILLDAVIENSKRGSPNDIEQKMFSALARNDPEGFHREHLRFKQTLKSDDYYYRKYFSIYEPMMEEIANLDTGMNFDAGLRAAEARYLKRAKDRIYHHTTEILDGGKQVEGLSCDVYALGLANLARHRGLSVSYSSPVIPTDVFAEPIA